MSPTPPQKVGPYEIIGPLGSGGMGQVFRARDPRLNREVAVKLLPPEYSADPVRKQRFEQEARAIAALNHPGIVSIYDVGDGWMVTELVEGETLRTSPAHHAAGGGRGRPDRRSAGGGSRNRHQPSRSEAGKRAAHARRPHENSGFRPGQDGHARRCRPNTAKPQHVDQPRRAHRNARVHVAGAGPRPGIRLPVRYLQPGPDAVRTAGRQARVSGRLRGGSDARHRGRGSSGIAGRACRTACGGSSSAASRRIRRSVFNRLAIWLSRCVRSPD